MYLARKKKVKTATTPVKAGEKKGIVSLSTTEEDMTTLRRNRYHCGQGKLSGRNIYSRKILDEDKLTPSVMD